MSEWINVKDKLPKLGDEIEAKIQSYGTEHIEIGKVEQTVSLFDKKQTEYLAFWYWSDEDDQYNFAGLNKEQNSTFYIKEWRLT